MKNAPIKSFVRGLYCFALGAVSLSAQELLVSIDFDDRSTLDHVSGESVFDTGSFGDGPLSYSSTIAKRGLALDVDYLRYLRIPLEVVAESAGKFTVKYDYYHRESKFDGTTVWHVHSYAIRDLTNGYGWSHGFRNIGNDFWSNAIVGFGKDGSQVKGIDADIPNFDKLAWHEYVLVFNETQLDWYVDGVFAYSQKFDTNFSDWDWSASDITIGARFKGGSITELDGEDYYRGTGGSNTRPGSMAAIFDNVRIWEGALDSATIASGVENLIEVEPFVSPSQDDVSVTSAAQSFEIEIESNTDWSFEGDFDWVRVTPASGSGNAVVTVEVDANDDSAARRADFSLGSNNFSILQSAQVAAVAADATIIVDSGNQLIDNVFFDVKSPSMGRVDQNLVNKLFIDDGFNGVRVPIYGTRDRPGNANGKYAHPEPGVVDASYYALELNIIKMALEVNPDLVIFASKKLNGPYSFPEWCLNAYGVDPKQYSILLADYIEYMASEGVPTHILGVDNERVFNEGKMMPDRFRKVVDELRILSADRGFPMPVIIGHEDYVPGRDDWMRILVNNGWSDRLDLFGTHYYPNDRNTNMINRLESDYIWAGELDRWHSELHWATKKDIPDILEIEDGAGSLFDMTDRGFSGLMWWDYRRTGLRGSMMRELTSNLLGYRPIVVTDHDGVDILTDGKLHTRAFRNGSSIIVWAMNLNEENDYQDYSFAVNSGTIAEGVSTIQWGESDPEGLAGEAESLSDTGFTVSMGPQSVTMIRFDLKAEDTVFSESWDSAETLMISGSGEISADNLWNYDMSDVSYASLESVELPLAGNALSFDPEDSSGAIGLVDGDLPMEVDPNSVDSVTMKVRGVFSSGSESTEGETSVGVNSNDGESAYEIVFSSNLIADTALKVRVRSADYGVREFEVGQIGDQVEGILYDVTATFKKVATNQTEVSYAIHRNRSFWKEGSFFVDASVGGKTKFEIYQYIKEQRQAGEKIDWANLWGSGPLTRVTVLSSQFSNIAIDDIEILASEPIKYLYFGWPPVRLSIGEERGLEPNVIPHNATNRRFEWRSENLDVATVDESGIVSAVGLGSTRIIATATDGSGAEGRQRIVVRNSN